MPRPRKDFAAVRLARQTAANARWSKLSPAKRREALAPAIAASPRTKRNKIHATD